MDQAAGVHTTLIDLPAPAPGWFDIAWQILADGALARFQADFDVLGEMRRRRTARAPGGSKWPWPPYPSDARAEIRVLDGAHDARAIGFPLASVYPRFDRLPDGSWIVADSRCRRDELNAHRFSRDGRLETSFSIGDGISHLQADAEGAIWVAYFDEGVFGAEAGETAPPLGQAGLNRFDADGRLLWAYDASEAGLGDRPIYDCEALNVAPDATWCCADSPIAAEHQNAMMRFGRGQAEAWNTDIFIAEAIAVQAGRAAVIARVYESPLQLTEFTYGTQGAMVRARCDLSAVGVEASRPEAILGRADTLHVIEGLKWWRLQVQQ